ncbi:MAG TPA: 50S ribosomal protein L18 [Actinomycetota bacterium]|nr:50S ribosomal protein L18 [Actinomycetota bacterium]
MKSSSAQRARRHRRVRKKVFGVAERPRLAVFKSNKHLYAQLIDDSQGKTIASASTTESDLRAAGDTAKAATEVGKLIATRAKEKGIEAVVFDRGGFRFHGAVRALADGARDEGLRF